VKTMTEIHIVSAGCKPADAIIDGRVRAGSMRVQDVPIADIVARPDVPAATIVQHTVDELAASIHDVGLISPIMVRPTTRFISGIKKAKWEILVGRHRVEACRQLGHTTIAAVISETEDNLKAEQIELEENLRRNVYSAAQRALMTKRLKHVYEALHPETRHGAGTGGRAGRTKNEVAESATSNGQKAAERFTKAAAKATGKSERTLQKDAERGEALSEATLVMVERTCLDQGEELDALAKLTPAKRNELIVRAATGCKVSAKVAVKQEARAAKEKTLGQRQQMLPDVKAGLIVEDYEWDDEVWSRETGMDRHAANHYPTSVTAHTPEEIVTRRPIESIVDRHCVLAMWSTIQHLAIAIKVMELRGFEYKSHYVWEKPSIGKGRWHREKHEILLIGTRGSPPCPAPGTQWASVIQAPRGEHSQKPDIFLEMLEQYFPTCVRVELNRRGPPRPGWIGWGNEAEHPVQEEHGTVRTTVKSVTSLRDSRDVARNASSRQRQEVICTQVRHSICALSGLPPAREVAEWLHDTDEAVLVDERLPAAATWLREFEVQWAGASAATADPVVHNNPAPPAVKSTCEGERATLVDEVAAARIPAVAYRGMSSAEAIAFINRPRPALVELDDIPAFLRRNEAEIDAEAPGQCVQQLDAEPLGEEVEDQIEPPLEAAIQPKPKERKVQHRKNDIEAALSEAFEEISNLAEECREVVDTAPDGLRETERIQTLGATADTLEEIDRPAVPAALADIEVSYSITLPKRKNRPLSRARRMADAKCIIRVCAEVLETITHQDTRCMAACALRDELNRVLMEAHGCEFPGHQQTRQRPRMRRNSTGAWR